MVTQVRYPVAPEINVRQGTLLDAATVRDDFAWIEDNDELFDSYNCLDFGSSTDFCAPAAKDFDQAAVWQSSFRFAAYGGVKCRSVGLDTGRMQSEVQRVFEAGESTAVERAFLENRFRARTGEWGAPVDLTPATGPVKPVVGVGLLEGYASSVYVGTPTIHMPITVASMLLGVNGVELNERVLRTRLDSKIAAGAGYDFPNAGPDGAAPAAGELWLYATGEVFVGRGPAIVRQVMAHSDNEVYVLAERGYVGAVDCFTAAVRVSVTA